jgi:hypothetical protein
VKVGSTNFRVGLAEGSADSIAQQGNRLRTFLVNLGSTRINPGSIMFGPIDSCAQ